MTNDHDPIIDRRHAEGEDYDGRVARGDKQIDDHACGMWSLFAAVKYAAREDRGERRPEDSPETLESLTIELLTLLERIWRAGLRYEKVVEAGLATMRRRKKPRN